MKKRTDELRKRIAEEEADFSKVTNHLKDLGEESKRIGKQFDNIGELLTDIDKDFSKVTGIDNKKDLSLLFVATGLQCAKWLIMGQVMPLDFDFKHDPNARERIDNKEGDESTKEKQQEAEDKEKEKAKKKGSAEDTSAKGFRTISQILKCPVPYDSMAAEKDTSSVAWGLLAEKLPLRRFYISPEMQSFTMPDGTNYPLCGKNHHAYTLGHDPILGWIFGTINIMSRSMTLKDPPLKTFHVKCDKGEGNKVSGYSDFGLKLNEAFQSYKENNRRLSAAVARQSIHFLSDKFCKTGLPIPLLSADKAQELIEQGWNSVEAAAAVKKVFSKIAKNAAIIGIQFIISFIINEIIKAIHLFLYDEKTDDDIRLYQVRTRKILLTSNCISSASNVLVSAGIAIATENPLEGAKRLDIGGFIETIHRLITDTKFIEEIKREYVREKLYERIHDSDFNWLYQQEG